MRHLLLLAALLMTVMASAGELKLRSVYSDHMLFQRDKPVVLLGRADAGAAVSVSMDGKHAVAKAGADGRFRVELPAMPAGGPYEVVVASGTNTVTLKDVLVGELWLCSGQSNMEMPVWGNNEFYRLTNGLEVAAQATDDDLRLLLVPRTDGKAGRCENPNDWDQWKHWERATPDSVKNFSATGYMFGKYLRKRLGIPVGLVNASWGGSRIEPWIPKRGSETEPEHYNGMIAPLVGFRFRGAVWYQGCANAHEWYNYDALQRRLVARWRQELDLPDLNFICVQLAGYLNHQPKTPHTAAQLAALKPTEDGFTFMRPAQTMIRAVKGCDCVTAFDLGMASDIHPKNKDEVGRRLAAAAANLCYGAQEPVHGPKPVLFARDGDAVLVTFDGPLAVKGGAIGPHAFTLKASGGERVWAEAKLVKPDTVRVSSSAVKNPLRVDYGWMPFMAKTSLYNDKGFPVEPFCRYVVEPDPQAKPVFIAHRGESVDAPENTLPAYKTAVERGFGFECDVYLSKDKRVFTFHDSNLNRTTGGANKSNCADASWAETLQYVDVGNWGKWKDSKFKGTRPALLEEVLALARDGKQIYVEVKTGPEIIPYIKKVVEGQYQATPKNMLFITFNEKTCAALKEAMPEFKAYLLLCARRSRDLGPAAPISAREMILQAKACHADGIDLQYVSEIHTADFIAEIRDAGLELHVWTVDDVAKSVEATARGAQSVTTNCAKKQQDALAVGAACAGDLHLNGSWEFRFQEGAALSAAVDPAFVATETMCVPGCFDVLPKYARKRGTALYRRRFTLEKSVANAWLVVDGMGLTANFRLDGRDLGVHPYPYAQLEIPTGPLAAGEHTLFAALDNRFDWDLQKLARPYYDFYLYGGFYHGVSLRFDNRRLFVRTRDIRTGQVEVELEGVGEDEGEGVERTLLFDGKHTVRAVFKRGRAAVNVPDFKLWTPEHPNLHTVALVPSTSGLNLLTTRFGIRTVEAKERQILLNGRPLVLKGANRHESHPEFGAATPESVMLADIQNLKALGGNFFRGAHYQQASRFLDLCDEHGVLVWEESLGWGNGSHHRIAEGEFTNAVFRAQQVAEMEMMIRASFNHPCVILTGFLNEFRSDSSDGKSLADELMATVRKADTGRLLTFACSYNDTDIAHANTDVVSFNCYPGWFDDMGVGDPSELRRKAKSEVDRVTARFRKLYPAKPILISEMGVCAVYGARDPEAAQWTEEFQAEYFAAAIDAARTNPDLCGIALWQFADAPSYHRTGAPIRGKPFAQNLAGIFDGYRRPKLAAEAVRQGFARFMRSTISPLP